MTDSAANGPTLPGVATPATLGAILGDVPAPWGSWRHDAVYASSAALRARDRAAELIGRLRALPGVRAVEAAPGGMLLITVTCPGEVVREIVESPGPPAVPGRTGLRWPDRPRTWDNPGFVVRYAHARAVAVRRWATGLGVPATAAFHPDALTTPQDRACVRVLAEWPSRSRRPARDPAPYLERLALAYHDAHEQAPALPKGDEPYTPVHIARLWLAEAVRTVLATGLTALGEHAPTRI